MPEAVAGWQEMKSEYEARMNKEREDTRIRYYLLYLLYLLYWYMKSEYEARA